MSGARAAAEDDVGALARLWFAGWQDGHAGVLPEELRRMRTLESFTERLRAALDHVRVMGPSDAPLGFHLIKDDELSQFYVAAAARGTGVAQALIADAELTISAAGFKDAWLACAIGNDRAARFYEKCGWRRAATIDIQVESPVGPYPLQVWRYEKRLAG